MERVTHLCASLKHTVTDGLHITEDWKNWRNQWVSILSSCMG